MICTTYSSSSAHPFWVGSVLHRSCTIYYNDRYFYVEDLEFDLSDICYIVDRRVSGCLMVGNCV